LSSFLILCSSSFSPLGELAVTDGASLNLDADGADRVVVLGCLNISGSVINVNLSQSAVGTEEGEDMEEVVEREWRCEGVGGGERR